MKKLFAALLVLVLLTSCKKKEEPKEPPPVSTTGPVINCPTCSFPDTAWAASTATAPLLVFKFKFDSTQVRLNNFGNPSVIEQGNAGQCPRSTHMSAHYIEMAETDLTQLGDGAVLYRAEETDCGGSKAIVFCKSVVCKDGEVFFSVPLNKVKAGIYKWLRVSLAYQNYDVKIKNTSAGMFDGTIASFVGFNNYVTKYKMKNVVMTPTLNPGQNKPQGYWGFYARVFNTDVMIEGQAPKTTVVNPNSSSPIPAGSCVVTGQFFNKSALAVQPLVITGTETTDVIITVSFSTNKSFEWKELTFDGLFQPEIGETVVDMGLRGMIPQY